MEISELRIGNYVLDNGLIHKIVSIRSKEYGKWVEDGQSNIIAMCDGAFYDCTEKEISPVPLTEELLLKIGAKKYLPSKVIYDRFCLSYLPWYHYWYVTDKESRCYITKIEFVHEFQNMIFALNGEELEVNL